MELVLEVLVNVVHRVGRTRRCGTRVGGARRRSTRPASARGLVLCLGKSFKACAGLHHCSSPLPATRVSATVLQAPPSTGQSCIRVLNIAAIWK